MKLTAVQAAGPSENVWARALDARDPRFDGVFFVGITSTGIYCRPVCPARVSYPDRRRFFDSAAAAERSGFRPCLRCRPELAPGRAHIDAVSRLASDAAQRIAAGALNGRSVAELARELGISERHLRRAFEREVGVTPLELAQTHRLLLAKRLLADTNLSVTRIAYASGFQSLRRFNAVFRERYRMSPSALRKMPPAGAMSGPAHARRAESASEADLVRLTLAYRAPYDWGAVLAQLRRDAIPGVEFIDGARYGRSVRLEGRTGVVIAEDARATRERHVASGGTHVNVDISTTLLPVLMPLLARLRHLFDLDAEPAVIDAHLERGGLDHFVRRRGGVRVAGALDGFEVALNVLLRASHPPRAANAVVRAVISQLGEPIEAVLPELARITPDVARVAAAGASGLIELGVPDASAECIAAVAREVAGGALRLEPGSDVAATRRALLALGVPQRLATHIIMRALHWPDAFPISDRALQRGFGTASSRVLRNGAQAWRPWRAYAAVHLWLHERGLADGGHDAPWRKRTALVT